MSPWLIFLLSAGAVILAGVRLSRDGDTIAERTGLGGAWVGAVLVAGATSLPELAVDISAVRQGHVSLAVGDLFGSSMANILILAVADLLTRHVQVLQRVAINQVLVGLLAITLTALAAIGISAHAGFSILNIGWAPLTIGLAYLAGMRLLHVNRSGPPFEPHAEAEEGAEGPGLKRAFAGFAVATIVVLVAAPYLASSTSDIAEQLGISMGLAGMILLAFATSLPELTVSIAAVRAGSYDLAVGNLLGSNCFNMVILLPLDVVEGPGPMLARVEAPLAAGALFAILMMTQAMMGVLNKSERRVWFLEPDAVFLILTYGVGLYLTYRVGP